MKNFTTSLAILALALVRVTVAMAAPTTTCPESQCKLKSELGECSWRNRVNEKGTQEDFNTPQVKQNYKCKKDGKPGFCCPAEEVSDVRKRECLTDETIDSEARHAQCDEGTRYGYCKRIENELFGQCESAYTAKVKCSADDPCRSHKAAKCEDRLKCVECTENKDCRGAGRWDPDRPQCHNGVCVGCFENKHCSGGYCEHGECGTDKMRCVGYTWLGDNEFSRGPGLIIKFSDKTEAHFHLTTDAYTRPLSVNYPYETRKQVKYDNVRDKWNRIVKECKKAVEKHTTFKWAGLANQDSFFNQKNEVSAVFNDGIPAIVSRAP